MAKHSMGITRLVKKEKELKSAIFGCTSSKPRLSLSEYQKTPTTSWALTIWRNKIQSPTISMSTKSRGCESGVSLLTCDERRQKKGILEQEGVEGGTVLLQIHRFVIETDQIAMNDKRMQVHRDLSSL